ncbi:hypothetical protein AA0488_0770 [Kozakia baliensis NRIC 0488]|nr:hypothetical protein AA0488_0770 [Kozakia baliensis NRIC 0488]
MRLGIGHQTHIAEASRDDIASRPGEIGEQAECKSILTHADLVMVDNLFISKPAVMYDNDLVIIVEHLSYIDNSDIIHFTNDPLSRVQFDVATSTIFSI